MPAITRDLERIPPYWPRIQPLPCRARFAEPRLLRNFGSKGETGRTVRFAKRRGPIPESKKDRDIHGFQLLKIDEVLQFYLSDSTTTLFVDARHGNDYEDGHIPRAVNFITIFRTST